MKKIEALYQEILQDEGLKGEFVQAAKDNQVEAFLQKNDCHATLAEVREFAEKKQGEILPLSDTELDAAAGGGFFTEAMLSIATFTIGCVYYAIKSAGGSGVGSREGTGAMLCSDVDYL